MKKYIDILCEEIEKAFEACGYDKKYARVSVSNRPDLCEYQCNGAMAAAKEYKCAPIKIAGEVVEKVKTSKYFDSVEAVNPGFININVNADALADYVNRMSKDMDHGFEKCAKGEKLIVDYGGANVAKPLHVGHLRSAIIGESVKRICKFAGYDAIGDVHLGDWGLQMGLVIAELEERKPDLPYFDENFKGEYPKEAPFDITELEDIYPAASKKSKEDEEFMAKAHDATFKLQSGYAPYTAIWKHIMAVSVADLKKNYSNLDVEFDLWKGESDVQPIIPGMVDDMIARGIAHESDGAMVIDVARDDDKREIPPCIVRKTDGAALYATSDLATIIDREENFQPAKYVYITDKRQELHFVQVFRAAKIAGIVDDETKFSHIGFGTMNGKDGKPFKTRDGGVMRLEDLIRIITDAVYDKIMENRTVSEEEARNTARIVGLSALKYGDLSNQATKDYVFDIERFASFEGNTGPYILYTMVRIKSILDKYFNGSEAKAEEISFNGEATQKSLMLAAGRFNEVLETVVNELAPHKLCAYIYDLANEFNRFYHEVKILAEEDESKKKSYIALLKEVVAILETSIDLLGFEAPERM